MARLTQLEEVLFPVGEHPVFVIVHTKTGERRLPVPGKKAIVNAETGRVLGVVSKGYRLVTNRQALDWAYECCCNVFPETKDSEWEVKVTDAPGTGGHCFIDLVHNSAALDFSLVQAEDRPDAFGPFIRVSNSYNGLRALAFDIGFFRKVCTNGMILPQSVIRFKFTHLCRDIGQQINFEIAHKRIEELTKSFGEYVGVLRECAVKRRLFKPLLFGILMIRRPKELKPNSPETTDWHALSSHSHALCGRYAEELGENAYALFNSITEFASRPPENRCIRRDRHSLQRLVGDWLSRFSQECRQPGFMLSEYLAKLAKANKNRTTATEVTLNNRTA